MAAPHADAVVSAAAAVDAGGNAIDAALAAAVTLTVVYPHQCSLGGDLIALVSQTGTDPTTIAVTSVGAAPADTDVAALCRDDQMPSQGPHTVTVPGAFAGWRALAVLGARLPLAEALERGRQLAETGVPVSSGLAAALRQRRDAVVSDPGLSAVFAPGGKVMSAGDRLVQPALATTFSSLATDPDEFYRGIVADHLVNLLRLRGGAQRQEDFADHQPVVEPALVGEIGSSRWWTAPPPSQGAALLSVLPTALDEESGTRALLVRCIEAAAVRDRELGDPRLGPIDVDALLGRARTRRAPEAAPADAAARFEPHRPAAGDTVAVTATDSDGTTVTLIQSVYQSFGAGILDPTTGIVLHNRGSAFSTDRSSPARLAPGARPPHTLCPVIARTPHGVIALGCQGGRAQPWILAQVAESLVEPAIDPAEVLARPRWVIGGRELGHPETTLVAEPGADAAIDAAREHGLPVDLRDGRVDEAGHVQVVRNLRRYRSEAELDGASDPRADGTARTLRAGHRSP